MSDSEELISSEFPTKQSSISTGNSRNNSDAQAQSQGRTRTPSSGQSQGQTRTPSSGQSQGQTRTPSQGQTRTPSQGQTRTPSQGQSQGQTRTPSQGQSQGYSRSPSQGISQSQSRSPSQGISQSQSRSPSQVPSVQSRRESQINSSQRSRSQSQSQSLSGSRTVSRSESRSDSIVDSGQESRTDARSDSQGRSGRRGGPDYKSLSKNVQMNLSFGAKFNCGMSTIRKYLCLFIFFDLVLHSLLYLQYLKHADDFYLMDLVECQMKCYDLQSSFIDILLFSIGRFIILETFYGIFRISSWAPVAVTTALSCVFVIVKPFYYDWELECQRVWPVTMMVVSFVLSWLEAFLIDFRLVCIEDLARKFADAKPDSYRKDLRRIGLFRSITPITAGLIRNIFTRSNSLTLVPAQRN